MRREPSEHVIESMPSGQDASLPKRGTGIAGMRWYLRRTESKAFDRCLPEIGQFHKYQWQQSPVPYSAV
jgi:hypothetical protein